MSLIALSSWPIRMVLVPFESPYSGLFNACNVSRTHSIQLSKISIFVDFS